MWTISVWGCAYDVDFKPDRCLRTDYNLTLGDILFLSHGIDTFSTGAYENAQTI